MEPWLLTRVLDVRSLARAVFVSVRGVFLLISARVYLWVVLPLSGNGGGDPCDDRLWYGYVRGLEERLT